jgi:anti-sigma factor RsiW
MDLRRSPYACQEMVELVTDYLEGTLGRRARRRFEAHLAGCEHCTEYVAQLRTAIRLSGTLSAGDFTPEMRDDFLALYQRWRQDPT